MRIEINEKGSRAFYKEVVNVVSQYRELLYKPEDKLKDSFVRYIGMGIAMAVFFILSLYGSLKGSFTTSRVLIMVFSAMAVVATIFILLRMKKMVDGYMQDDRPSVVTLDENGVEIEKTGSQAVRLAWENVAFVRSFAESTCFFSKDFSGIVLSVNNNYSKEIFDYIKSNDIDVKVVKYV